jgi:hypothetical protein
MIAMAIESTTTMNKMSDKSKSILESFPVSAEIEQTAMAAVPVPVGW